MVKNWAIEKIFLIISLVFGFLYILILPPFQSVDEGAHFFRTFQISQGKFLAKNINNQIGDALPTSLTIFQNNYAPLIKNIEKKTNLKEIKNTFSIKTAPEIKQFTEFPNTALYSPICYISQIVGVITGNCISNRLAIAFYLGRLCNLLFYCLIVYYAIKIIPFYKIPLLCLAVMPMSLSLASAYSSDVMVLGLNFLWIALLLKILTNKSKLYKFKDKEIFYLILTSLFITLSKTYILALPLIFLLPVSKFKTKRDYILSISTICVSSFAALLCWMLLIKGLTLNMNNAIANPELQSAFIKAHPIQYIGIMLKTFLAKTPRLYITMVGVLGWQDTVLDYFTYFIYPFLIYFGIRIDEYNFQLAKWQKSVIGITILIGVLITYTSLYIMWSPVANNVILGLNGKYFIPLMLPLFLLFKSPKSKYNFEIIKYVIIIILIFILLSSEVSLLHRFYDITPNLYYKI